MSSSSKNKASSSKEAQTQKEPSDLAKALSSTIPDYLLSLAHEPSIGLHYVATHAQARVAPTLARTTKQVEKRTTMINNLTLDVKDAVAVVKDDMPKAERNLKEMNEKIEKAIKTLQQN